MSHRDTINHEKKFLQNSRKQAEIVIPGNPGSESGGDPESRIFKGFWIPAGVYPVLDTGPE